ncbi:MAG TPA: condensation domain-containing protein, partial [Ktedonobacteraceae bacterium]|nr:condensation domain-containing protein [Ktedonobacteraceae bacterium]
MPITSDQSTRATFPLSFGQQRLWFLDQLTPGNPAYHVRTAVRLVGPLNVMALERCLNGIIYRHEILRTTFGEVGGQPIQIVADHLALQVQIIDLQHHPDAHTEKVVQSCTVDEVRRPFNLTQGPLLRAVLLRLHPTEHILLLTMHHIITDGWSVGVFIRELCILYSASFQKSSSPLPNLPFQYADYALWQRQWLQGNEFPAQLAYWKDRLFGIPPRLALPADRSRALVQTFSGAIERFQLTAPLSTALRTLGQRNNVTSFMTLVTAFKVLLGYLTGEEDIVVGSPIANRNRRELEGLIGFFVNYLVLRTRLDGNPTFSALLQRVRQTALGAYAHQDLPFDKLVEELQPKRDLSCHPLFQFIFSLQNIPQQAVELPGIALTRMEIDSGTSKVDLMIEMREAESGFVGFVEYNTDLFGSATIKKVIFCFISI